MPKLIYDGCRRCPTAFDPDSPDWFINDEDHWLHACADGQIGVKCEIDKDGNSDDDTAELTPDETERIRAKLKERLENAERKDVDGVG